ncbi:MAG: hypothetical protein M1820_010353 [Bogoriella megaspora]|nr:MAG: hypothetical protein M1820_010353 [Bogoriella megaspora]
MPNTSSRKRPTLRTQATQEETDRPQPDILTSDVGKDVRRSARIAERRLIKETPNQQDTSRQTTLLQRTGKEDKRGEKTQREIVKRPTPLRASGKATQTSPVRGKQRARRGNQNRPKRGEDRVSRSSAPLRARTTSARALSEQREQTGSNKTTRQANTTGRSSRGKRGKGQSGRQRWSLERKASERAGPAGYQLEEEVQGRTSSQQPAPRERSSRRQTKTVEEPRRVLPDIEQPQQENPTKETEVGHECSLDIERLDVSNSVQITAWTNQIVSPSPERVNQEQALREQDVPLIAPVEMDTNTTSSTNHDESTLKGRKGKSVKVSQPKLSYRRVSQEPIPEKLDPKLTELRQILKTQFPERTIADVPSIPELLRNFLMRADTNITESCYPFVDDLSFELDKEKSTNKLPLINAQYFEANLARCLTRNEAVLQRTVMMTIFNQHWLGQKFDWNTEGQWSQPKDSRMPSRLDDEISLPKPDLAISFTRKSFTGLDFSAPIPPALEKCLSPEGYNRCFPFLFMEVKKAASDLQEAYLSNLNNASQALYNMYQWMARVDEVEKFEEKVRVFTLVFNAEDMLVRVHRCKREADEQLYFYFEELRDLVRYSRDEAWGLVNSILEDYAAVELHATLEAAYKEVVKQMDETVQAKRKAEAAQKKSAKRARGSGSGGLDYTNSFGMSSLET